MTSVFGVIFVILAFPGRAHAANTLIVDSTATGIVAPAISIDMQKTISASTVKVGSRSATHDSITCGGTLVQLDNGEQAIVTAAHCALANQNLIGGKRIIQQGPKPFATHDVAGQAQMPDYKTYGPNETVPFANTTQDMAVMVLKEKLDRPNPLVKICPRDFVPKGPRATVLAGYGMTEKNQPSFDLRFTSIDMPSDLYSSIPAPNPPTDKERNDVLVGLRNDYQRKHGNGEVCKFDSGSGLYAIDPRDPHTVCLVAVTDAFDNFNDRVNITGKTPNELCARDDAYSVFARANHREAALENLAAKAKDSKSPPSKSAIPGGKPILK